MDLVFSKLRFVLHGRTEGISGTILQSLKRGFREYFESVNCARCGGCDRPGADIPCPCRMVFGQKLAADPDAVKRHQKPSLPFVFSCSPMDPRGGADRQLCLDLVLVGSAMNLAWEFSAAVGKFVASLPYLVVTGIETLDCSGNSSPVTRDDHAGVLKGMATIALEDLSAISSLPDDKIRLRFLSPVQILQDGKPIREFSFAPFLRSLLRRVSSLAYYYCGSVLDLEFRRLSHLSGGIDVDICDMRPAGGADSRHYGLTGSCILSGDLSPFMPLLIVGEYLNCGKGAAYGMGSYEIY